MKINFHNFLIIFAFVAGINRTAAQGTTAFTYQGQLHDGGTNANGTYAMIFALYDSATDGNEIGNPITTSPTLANGLFTVNLDFGASAFDGSARWLDITVQSGSDSEDLAPRVQILPAPYAIFANIANTSSNLNGTLPASQLTNTLLSAQLGGTYSNAITLNNPSDTFTGDGSELINLNASQLLSGTVPSAVLKGAYGNAVTFGNSGNSFSGNGNGLVDLNAANLAGTISDDRLSDNVPLLDADQTFTGQNAFDQGFSIGDWDIGIDEYNGVPDILTFSQDGNYRMVIVPDGYGFGEGSDAVYGIHVYGNVGCDSIDMTGNGTGVIAGVTTIEGAEDGDSINMDSTTITGGLNVDEISVSGDVGIEGDLNVDGTINGVDGDGGGDDIIVAKTELTSTSSQDILNRVAQLSISSWNSKQDSKHTASHHISPKAYDFNTAFGFENGNHFINLVDETGVAFAAIQGLNEKLKEKDVQIEALNKRLTALEQLVNKSTQK